MSLLGLPSNRFMSATPSSATGLTTSSFRQSKPQEAPGCTTSAPSSSRTEKGIGSLLQQRTPRRQQGASGYATAGSPVMARATISKGRSPTCGSDIRSTSSCLTSAPASTGSGKGLTPFWNKRCLEESRRLWLPTVTDWQGSPSSCSKGSFTSVESGSWFSMQEWTHHPDNRSSPTIFCPSSTSSSVATTAGDGTSTRRTAQKEPKEAKAAKLLKKPKKPSPNAALKVRVRPDAQTAVCLKRWFGCVRKTYNWALSEVKNRHKKLDWWREYLLKNRFVTRCNIPKRYEYLYRDAPKHVREGAIKDLVSAYRSNVAKRKKNPHHTWDVKYRSRKDPQAIVIPGTVLKMLQSSPSETSQRLLKMYPTYLAGALSYHVRSLGDVRFDHDCRLSMDKLNRFYLHIPYVRLRDSQAKQPTATVALDPGVRSFMTGYSPQGTAFSIGDRDISRIQRLCQHLDDLVSRTEAASRQHRWRMRRAIVHARLRIRNLVTELHCKAVRYLTTRYRHVLIPSFEVSGMVVKRGRRIGRKTVRQMLTWRHYDFRQRLLSVADREGVRVTVCTEEYTSKTCTSCGHLHQKLGSSKVFRCPACRCLIDRDMNGARNIYLKNEHQCSSAAQAALPR